MKMKILVWTVVVVFILVVLSGAVWYSMRPQIITFDDGDKLTLLAVDYGKKHASPTPQKHSFNTASNALVLWVRQQHDPNQYGNFQYYLYDKAGTACVMGQYGYYPGGRRGNANDVAGIQFPAFPRRAGSFYVRVEEFGNGGQELSDQKFIIHNPAHGSFSNLSASPLPDTEQDGDMTVSLKKLVAGAKMPYNRGDGEDDDAINKGVQATFNVQIDGTNANMWTPVSFETTDATGNHVNAMVYPQQTQQIQVQSNDVTATYQYGLWPDEPWKMRVEFSKQSGFDNTELWTVPAIPLDAGRQNDFWNYNRKGNNATNVFAETDVGGLHLKVYRAKYFTDMPPNSNPQGGLAVEVDPSLPDGTRLTIVSLTDDQTNDINHWDAGWNGGGRRGGGGAIYHYSLQNVDGATNLNLTLAIHKSHYLEFTAKPEMAAADSSDQSSQQQ